MKGSILTIKTGDSSQHINKLKQSIFLRCLWVEVINRYVVIYYVVIYFIFTRLKRFIELTPVAAKLSHILLKSF
jgi:hypothetical protein